MHMITALNETLGKPPLSTGRKIKAPAVKAVSSVMSAPSSGCIWREADEMKTFHKPVPRAPMITNKMFVDMGSLLV